ncbi:methylthioribose kinase-like isoform X2 [Liolophura sinensis]|uniref:methylthioribose kinase-like isoform X2 n=1 Tax=Liolophura sinensis TaxID=3198878 RepID=UPI0031593ADA
MAPTSDPRTFLSLVSSLIVKHTDKARLDTEVLGPDYPLSVERLRMEYKALTRFNKLAVGWVPEVYFFDEEHSIMCMEYLEGFSVLKKTIIRGEFHPDVARHLGIFMAAIHGATHSAKLTQNDLQKLSQEFQNPGPVKLTEQFVFTRPFTADDDTNVNPDIIKPHLPLVYDNPNILAAAREMKSLFLEKKECLVHGDLHTGSVMVNQSLAKVIDAEFAYVGPAAFDVGSLVAHYLMAYFCHMSIADNHDVHRAFAQTMADACRHTADAYFEHLDVFTGQTKAQYQETFMTEVAGFAGCEILRRYCGHSYSIYKFYISRFPEKPRFSEQSLKMQSVYALVKNVVHDWQCLTELVLKKPCAIYPNSFVIMLLLIICGYAWLWNLFTEYNV